MKKAARVAAFVAVAVLVLTACTAVVTKAAPMKWKWLTSKLRGRDRNPMADLIWPWKRDVAQALMDAVNGRDPRGKAVCKLLKCKKKWRRRVAALAAGEQQSLLSLAAVASQSVSGGHGTMLAAALVRRATAALLERDGDNGDGTFDLLA